MDREALKDHYDKMKSRLRHGAIAQPFYGSGLIELDEAIGHKYRAVGRGCEKSITGKTVESIGKISAHGGIRIYCVLVDENGVRSQAKVEHFTFLADLEVRAQRLELIRDWFNNNYSVIYSSSSIAFRYFAFCIRYKNPHEIELPGQRLL